MNYSDSIAEKVIDFIQEFVRSLQDGYLFFGSRADIIRYVVDILLIAFLFYWFLIFLKQTRAWQLMKGIILIFLFVVVCSFFGLQMVGFIFNKLLYVIAFAFIVIFQPELRRVLETVGIRSFGKIKSTFGNVGATTQMTALVNDICSACKEMSKTYTGALILLERTTSLEDLLSQENVVRMDSSVSSSVLQSIFYKGAPMHDGAVLIRNNRIVATRCHVPLSVTMQHLERSGTRHRAAVGASEIGDTIAVVVSEERGKTSIAVNGRLFEMKDSKELEANLSYLLGLSNQKEEKQSVGSVIRNVFKKEKPVLELDKEELIKNTTPKKSIGGKRNANARSSAPVIKVTEAITDDYLKMSTSENSESAKVSPVIERFVEGQKVSKVGIIHRLVFIMVSILFSTGLWMYIQINNNPIKERTISLPIRYDNVPNNMDISYSISNVEVTVVGRQNTINRLDSSIIAATPDYSSIDSAGYVELPIIVYSNNDDVYFRVSEMLPERVQVNVYEITED